MLELVESQLSYGSLCRPSLCTANYVKKIAIDVHVHIYEINNLLFHASHLVRGLNCRFANNGYNL